MTPLETRLRELLERALFIPKDQHADILAADALTQVEILKDLEAMDDVQTKMFGRVLDKAPWFFEACEQKIEARQSNGGTSRK